MTGYNTGLSSGLKNVRTPAFAGSDSSKDLAGDCLYGRVLDVILDMSHKDVKHLGGTQALYGVFYQPLFVASTESTSSGDWFAYCGNQTVRQIPIKGEIVKVEYQTAGSVAESTFKSDGPALRAYWTEIVPVWNHPHLNEYPDTVKHKTADLGKDFEDNQDIKPLQLNAGDVTIEGRHGNTIRFGGTKSSNSPFCKDVNGKPYIIIRNGQKNTDGDTVYEDVNDDDTSLYLTSDHKVPITEANRKFKGATKAPDLTAKYQGKQLVGNSDRVVLNAREDNLVLSAKKHASINADSVSIDGEKYIGTDAPKIYLGTKAQKEDEPVLLGETTSDHIARFYDALNNCLELLTKGPTQTAYEAVAVTAFNTLKLTISTLKGEVKAKKLESKKVYTE